MQKQKAKTNGKALSLTLRRRLEALVDEMGEIKAAEELGLSRQTLFRAMAGRPIHRGTTSMVEAFAAREAK
jgi:hypothetical protein